MIKFTALAFIVMMAFAAPAQAATIGDKVQIAAACFEMEDALEAASIGAHDGRDAINAYFQKEGNSCQFMNGPPIPVTIDKEIKTISGKAATVKVFEISDVTGGKAWVIYKVPDKDA